MSPGRVIIGVAAYQIFGMAFFMIWRLGESVKYHMLGEALRSDSYSYSLPLISQILLPAAPFAWWGILSPLFLAVGFAARFPTDVCVRQGIMWVITILIVSAVVIGVFLPFMQVTSSMGYPVRGPASWLEMGVNLAVLTGSAVWMISGILRARKLDRTSPAPDLQPRS